MRKLHILSICILSSLFSVCKISAQTFFDERKITCSLVTNIAQDNEGFVWIGTDNGLNRFDGYNFVHYFHNDNDSTTLVGNSIRCLYSDRQGMWIGTNRGLQLYNPRTNAFVTMRFSDGMTTGISQILRLKKSGTLCVVTTGHGAFLLKDDVLDRLPLKSLPFEANTVVRIYEDSKGMLWLLTQNNGICRYDPRSGKVATDLDENALESLGKETAEAKASLSKAKPTTSNFTDRDNNLWTLFSKKGLQMLPQNSETFKFAPLASAANAVLRTRQNTVFAATEGGVLYRIDNDAQTTEIANLQNGVSTMHELPDGNLIIGFYSGGIGVFNPTTNAVTYKKACKNSTVKRFATDSKGNIYFAAFGEGIYLYDLQKDEATFLTLKDLPIEQRMQDSHINALICDENDILWIGHQKGIDRFDTKTRKILQRKEGDLSEALSSMACISIVRDSKGVMWLGTDNGLYRWDSKTLLHLTAEDNNLSNNMIVGLMEDREGFIWATSYKGLNKVSPDGSDIRNYHNSFLCEYLRGACHYNYASGNMLLGGNKGVVLFSPKTVGHDFRKRQVYVMYENAVVNGGGPLDIAFEDNTFTLSFTALDYSNSEGICYEFRFKGDSRWSSTQPGFNTITLSNLASGSYTLEVRASLYGELSETTEITIHVGYPWYLSWWAWILYILILALVLFQTYTTYIHRLRAKEAGERNRFLVKVAKNIRTPLTMLISPLETLLHEPHSETTARYMDTMYDNLQRIVEMLNSMLKSNKAEEEVVVHKFLEDKDFKGRQDEDGDATGEETKGRKSRNSHKPQVLLASADDNFREFTMTELSERYRVQACTTANECVSHAQKHKVEIIIADIAESHDMLRSLKKNSATNHIPVIMLTDNPSSEQRLRHLEDGADVSLTKPFLMAELVVRINTLLRQRQLLKGKFSGKQEEEPKVDVKAIKGNDEVLLERINASIHAHLNDGDFSTEQLASEVGLSRVQLHRRMKDLTGITPSDYMKNIRFKHAAALLRERKLSISQVAYMSGFNNTSHFSTAFKKHFGLSPTEFMENGGNEEPETSE